MRGLSAAKRLRSSSCSPSSSSSESDASSDASVEPRAVPVQSPSQHLVAENREPDEVQRRHQADLLLYANANSGHDADSQPEAAPVEQSLAVRQGAPSKQGPDHAERDESVGHHDLDACRAADHDQHVDCKQDENDESNKSFKHGCLYLTLLGCQTIGVPQCLLYQKNKEKSIYLPEVNLLV